MSKYIQVSAANRIVYIEVQWQVPEEKHNLENPVTKKIDRPFFVCQVWAAPLDSKLVWDRDCFPFFKHKT